MKNIKRPDRKIPAAKVSKPARVRGSVPVVSPGGKACRVQNPMTLCWCGKSDKKPFCDGSHGF